MAKMTHFIFEVEVGGKDQKQGENNLAVELKKVGLYLNRKKKEIEWNNWIDPQSWYKLMDWIGGKKYIWRISISDKKMITSVKKNKKKMSDFSLVSQKQITVVNSSKLQKPAPSTKTYNGKKFTRQEIKQSGRAASQRATYWKSKGYLARVHRHKRWTSIDTFVEEFVVYTRRK